MNKSTNETIVAFVRLMAGLIAAVLCGYGFAVDAGVVYNVITVIVAAFIFVHQWWWKNNNVTSAATEAQEFIDIAKATESLIGEEDVPVDGEDGDAE